MDRNTKELKLKISVENEALCGSAFFSLMKKFIAKLEDLCARGGVCTIANIELGESQDAEKSLKTALFDVRMNDGRIIRIATGARTLEDAISNAFDECALEMLSLQENRA
ncbi:hypothetical protein [Sediminibacterium soli]|uniref:hypothetical protein n=1 Tax=Sediminibacterium soli TaxID=2698829 RepID=UPI00137A2633|nr:hypothetical protein [Sediminibacterium soli]NCI45885.1 hypothetical protein [Sediminibacterium soli]